MRRASCVSFFMVRAQISRIKEIVFWKVDRMEKMEF